MVLFKLILNKLNNKLATTENGDDESEKPKLFRWRVDNSMDEINYEMLTQKVESILPDRHGNYNITWNDGVDECVVQSTEDLKECLEFIRETNPSGCVRLNIYVNLTSDLRLTKENEKNIQSESTQVKRDEVIDEITDPEKSDLNEVNPDEEEEEDSQVNEQLEGCESQSEDEEQDHSDELNEINKNDNDTTPTAPPIPIPSEAESQYHLPYFKAYPALWPPFSSPYITPCDPVCYPVGYLNPENKFTPVSLQSAVPSYPNNNNIYPSLASIAPSTSASSTTTEPAQKDDNKVPRNKAQSNELTDKQKSKKKKLGKLFGNTSHSHQRRKNSSTSRHNSPAPVVKLSDEKIKYIYQKLIEMGFVEDSHNLTETIKTHNGDINAVITHLEKKK